MKNMAIFVTQDDAGGEPDHVDAQRSVLLVISPWARHGHVSHRHTTPETMHAYSAAIRTAPGRDKPSRAFDHWMSGPRQPGLPVTIVMGSG